LSVVASSETVGEYAAVKSIVMIVLLPATALFHLLLPAAVRRFDGTTTSEDQHILWAGVAGIAVAGAVAFVLGDAIMATLYGPRFAGLGPAVAWGAIGAALYGVSLLRGAVWIARGEAGAFSAIVAGAAILGAVFLFLFPTLATTFGAARVGHYRRLPGCYARCPRPEARETAARRHGAWSCGWLKECAALLRRKSERSLRARYRSSNDQGSPYELFRKSYSVRELLRKSYSVRAIISESRKSYYQRGSKSPGQP